MAGVGAPSTRETISLAKDAAAAGADFALVIAPGYFAAALKAGGPAAVRRFFVDVAGQSPVPVYVLIFLFENKTIATGTTWGGLTVIPAVQSNLQLPPDRRWY